MVQQAWYSMVQQAWYSIVPQAFGQNAPLRRAGRVGCLVLARRPPLGLHRTQGKKLVGRWWPSTAAAAHHRPAVSLHKARLPPAQRTPCLSAPLRSRGMRDCRSSNDTPTTRNCWRGTRPSSHWRLETRGASEGCRSAWLPWDPHCCACDACCDAAGRWAAAGACCGGGGDCKVGGERRDGGGGGEAGRFAAAGACRGVMPEWRHSIGG